MAKVLETLIARGRRVRRPKEQREVAFGLADLSTHPEVHQRRSAIYLLRRKSEPSLMAKGIFAAASKESQAIVDANSGAETDKN